MIPSAAATMGSGHRRILQRACVTVWADGGQIRVGKKMYSRAAMKLILTGLPEGRLGHGGARPDTIIVDEVDHSYTERTEPTRWRRQMMVTLDYAFALLLTMHMHLAWGISLKGRTCGVSVTA